MNYYKVYFYGNNEPKTVLGMSKDTVMNEFVEMFGVDSVDRVEPVSIHQTEKDFTQRGAQVSILTGYNPFANYMKKVSEEKVNEKEKTIMVVDPKSPEAKKGGGVVRIPASKWKEYEKKGYILAEEKKDEDGKTININVDGKPSEEGTEEEGKKDGEVEIDKDSPDANKDGKVDAKDDLNGDGKVDKKDLKIAELEKDLRIKQLQKEMDDLDDPAPEAKMKEAKRLRIKDRGDSFECIDEAGKCVKKFPYDNKETFARSARYDAQRFAEKYYSKQLGEEVELEEKLKVSDGLGAWVDDFVKSDAPQFSGKDKEERKNMAIAAFTDAGGKLEEGENKQVKGGDPCWPGFEMVGMKMKDGREVPNCVPVNEATAIEERRKFIFAAMQAKKEGKKKFLFQGKEYPVTIKEEIEQVDEKYYNHLKKFAGFKREDVSEAVDKKVLATLQALEPEETKLILQGMPKKDRKEYMKALGIKETVDGRTRAYKETVSRLMAKKESVSEKKKMTKE